MKEKKFPAGFILCILIPFIFLTHGCNLEEYGLEQAFYRIMSVETRANSLTTLPKENTDLTGTRIDPRYDVLIITDVHFGNENKGKNGPRREDEWFEKLQKGAVGSRIIDKVKFAICLGDVADHGREEEFKRFKESIEDRLMSITTSMAPDGIKTYNVVGNHDLYNSGWDAWSRYCSPGTSFYKFETPSFSWYFIDSASGTLGGYQYDTLSAAMSADTKDKLVFSHVPIYAEDNLYFTMQNTKERNLLISLCAKTGTRLFIDGHTHKDRTSDFGKFTERNIPGFLAKYKYGILHVDEDAKTVELEIAGY